MSKKLCKNTAIIVAIASILCSTPVSASVKLKTTEGIVKSAAVYDGSYVYSGHKGDTESDSVYFNSGNSDTEINDAKYYEFKFDEKYNRDFIVVKEFKDQKLNLASGKVEGDFLEDIENNLKKQLKEEFADTARYSSDSNPVIKRVDKGSFNKPLYQYYTDKYTGFTDIEGNYIDVSYIANISVVGYDGRLINIADYNQNYSGLTAKFINTNIIAQDDNYIYALTNINIAGSEAPSESSLTYLQKISKQQGNMEDGVYLPNSVESYELTKKYNSDSAQSAYYLLSNTYKIIAKDGSLYVVQKSLSDEITVIKLALKNEKVELNNGSGISYNVNLVEQEEKITKATSVGANFDIDCLGNVWSINNGVIFKIDGLTVSDLYKCDSKINTIKAFDENNLVAWNEHEGIYCNILKGHID